MLRDAINEIRLHPGRFVATLLAVAISVGFISAIMIGVRTEENSMTRSGAIAVSKSDVVVEQVSANEQIKPDEVLKAIQGASGVTQAETSMVALFPLTHENFSVYSNAIVLPSAEFRWASLAEGSWPSKEEEITLALLDELLRHRSRAGPAGIQVGRQGPGQGCGHRIHQTGPRTVRIGQLQGQDRGRLP